MESVFIGRQPILNTQKAVCAFEILYRSPKEDGSRGGDRETSASVINSILNKFGRVSLLGNTKAFIKIDEKFLLHDLIFTIPKEFFIFAIFESVEMNDKVVERMMQLYKKGYTLAINDMLLSEKSLNTYETVFPYLSYVKVEIESAVALETRDIIGKLQAKNIKVVATKIETQESYESAKECGCNCFQGYFFAKPVIVEHAEYSPSRFNVLKLYNLLLQDVNIDEITDEFENNPEITVQLLQFINSAAFHFRNKISSIHHVITLVGRVKISQWLMLMIYSKSVSKTGTHSPLMLMIKSRTELMESVLKAVRPDAGSNMLGEAYMVGVLSLIDTLFGMPLADLLERINISDEVKAALLEEKGLFGEIYKIVKCTESLETCGIKEFEEKYHLENSKIQELLLNSIEETQKLANSQI